MNGRSSASIWHCLLGVCLAVIAGCSDGSSASQERRTGATPHVASVPASSNPGMSSLPDFAPLVRAYGGAVVNVQVVQQPERMGIGPGRMSEDPLADFFRRFGLPSPETEPRSAPPARGTGSGFIVTPDGYILTNAHVVADADQVSVQLTDRREFQAKVVGSDSRTDVAVIKIDATQLPTVRIGDSSKLQPGQWVLAIGSPFGLDNSATAGIVSATARAVGANSYVPFIQTDVAVNPGNSGGPLFNLQGEVVGINSMIFSQTGGYMGLSFAIPIDVAIDVRDQLIKTGRVVRGRIGVAVQDVNAPLAQSFGLDRPRGALVGSVDPEGPAAKAGLQPGDVILSVNGNEIDRYGALSTEIASLKPGSKVNLAVWRDRKERNIEVRIEELREPESRRGNDAPTGEGAATLGLTVRPLTRAERQGVATAGALVVEAAEGAAAEAGIEPGDIVLGVNGRQVKSAEQLRDAVKTAKGAAALLIQRGEAQIFIPVPLSK